MQREVNYVDITLHTVIEKTTEKSWSAKPSLLLSPVYVLVFNIPAVESLELKVKYKALILY